jgi:hypothetical protein
MSRLPTPNLVPSAVLPPRTVLRKIMLHLPRQGYPIGSTAASPGGLVTAALAPVFFCQSVIPTSVNACTSCFPRGVLSRNLDFVWKRIQVTTDWTESASLIRTFDC